MAISFAMHADESGYSYEAGLRLAESIAEEIAHAAEDRKLIPGIRFEQPESEPDV
jgi:hypothetical protein